MFRIKKLATPTLKYNVIQQNLYGVVQFFTITEWDTKFY